MNWLIYISGFFLWWAIINKKFGGEAVTPDEVNFDFYAKLVLSIMSWTWFCWRFIK